MLSWKVIAKLHNLYCRKYTATFRNNVRSKSWYYDDDKADNSKPNYNLSHNAIKIESLRIIFDKNTSTLSKKFPNRNKPEKFVSVTERAQHVLLKMNNNVSENLKKLDSGVVGELEQYRFLPNVTLVFNLSNEPCIKYNLHTVADKGIDNKNSTRHRVQHDGEAIYLESAQHRFVSNMHIFTICVDMNWHLKMMPFALHESMHPLHMLFPHPLFLYQVNKILYFLYFRWQGYLVASGIGMDRFFVGSLFRKNCPTTSRWSHKQQQQQCCGIFDSKFAICQANLNLALVIARCNKFQIKIVQTHILARHRSLLTCISHGNNLISALLAQQLLLFIGFVKCCYKGALCHFLVFPNQVMYFTCVL